jgi:molybdate transport system substrate-binding protein
MPIRSIVAACASLLLSHAAAAADITVLAAGATRDTCLDLFPSFEKESGHHVVAIWAAAPDIRKRLAAGEIYDVVVTAAPEIEALIKQGKIVPGSEADLMKTAVGVAVKAGMQKPDLRSAESLKQALLAAKSIGHSAGSSGVYVKSLLERLGIAEQVKAKVVEAPPGVRVGTLIAKGDVEIGLQQASELIHEPGIDYVGLLPAEIGNVTVYTAGIHGNARAPAAAKELIKYLSSPAALPAIKAHGMEPG